jgi:hypothetical protein
VYALELVDTISERIKPSLSDCVVLEASSKHEEDSNANAVGQLLTQSLDRLIVVSTSMLGAGSDFKGVTMTQWIWSKCFLDAGEVLQVGEGFIFITTKIYWKGNRILALRVMRI